MSLEFDRFVELAAELIADTDRLLLATPADAPVPGCPGWDATELRDHCAGVLAFWTHQLGRNVPVSDGFDFPEAARDRHRLPLGELGVEVMDAFRAAGSGSPCWNWSGQDFTSGWAARRLANEFGVHHADAQAAAGSRIEIAADLAGDGIDEIAELFMRPPANEAFAQVGVLGLEANGRSWRFELGNGIRSTDMAATAWVRGPVDQILMHLWGRPSGAVESGDPTLMAHWRQLEVFN
ncbi:MAG: maleylpyruvate isomerase family mycothiol-dependent enzyme [Acidimicrobiales bacterium]|jgi:uncharacterized protein (TIGR03083 family)